MTQLVYRIKDLEALRKGLDVDVTLGQDYLREVFSIDVPGAAGADADKSSGHVVAHLDYQDGFVLCRGTLKGAVSAQCQRCLGPAALPVDVSLNMTFVPVGNALPVRHDENAFDPFDPDDVDYAHHDREVVDLRPIVREQLLLALPIAILCRDDCQGLCPVCGSDLNVASCTCDRNIVQSPFAVLKNFKN